MARGTYHNKALLGLNIQGNLGLSLGLNIFGDSFPKLARVSVWLFCIGGQCTSGNMESKNTDASKLAVTELQSTALNA